jgi:hypothetical protein
MKTDFDLGEGGCGRRIGNRMPGIDHRQDRFADEGRRNYFRALNSVTNRDAGNETIIMLLNP